MEIVLNGECRATRLGGKYFDSIGIGRLFKRCEGKREISIFLYVRRSSV